MRSNLLSVKVKRYLNYFRVVKYSVLTKHSESLLVYRLRKIKIVYGTNIFKCKESGFVMYDVVSAISVVQRFPV